MTVKLEIAYIPIILPNHDHVWPNHVHLTSSLHHQIDQTFPLLVDKKIIARIMFAGEREGLGTRLCVCTSAIRRPRDLHVRRVLVHMRYAQLIELTVLNNAHLMRDDRGDFMDLDKE